MRLDRTGTKAITAIDIATFLQENGRPQYSAKDCEPVITYFDVDEDRCLSYQEFMQMILPCDNLVLRADAAQRQTGRFDPRGGRLGSPLEVALVDFFEREINLHLKLETMKLHLMSRHDWNTQVAFQMCDCHSEGTLSHKSLQTFLKLNGHFASDEEIIAIVRRLDADAS